MMKKLTLKQAQQIKNEFGTPVYLYSLDKIHQQYYMIRKSLSTACDIFYSMKANPLLGICQYIAKQKAGCEVSSKNELLTAIQAGFKPEDIIFVGPGKTETALSLCVEKKIKAIICESVDEIVSVNNIAKKHAVIAQVMVRLNPAFHIDHAPIKMSGLATQFGIDVSQFKKDYSKIQLCNHINLCGMQIYNGSRILNENAIITNVENILKCASELSSQLNINWKYIDVGGGFGIPYFKNESSLNIKKIVPTLNRLFLKYKQSNRDTNFILELGRYLVAESGILIASVLDTKINHEKHFAVIDAGMQCHLSSTGLNSFVQRNFPSMHISQNKVIENKISYQVAGPLCTPGDVILRDVVFNSIKKGDFIVLFNVGAYGYTASPIRFLSHDPPAEVLMLKQKMVLGRRRETISELLHLQSDLSRIF